MDVDNGGTFHQCDRRCLGWKFKEHVVSPNIPKVRN